MTLDITISSLNICNCRNVHGATDPELPPGLRTESTQRWRHLRSASAHTPGPRHQEEVVTRANKIIINLLLRINVAIFTTSSPA